MSVAPEPQAMSKKKRRMLEQLSPEQLEVYNLGNFLTECCKTMDLQAAIKSYTEAKSRGVYPPRDSFNNLLALAAGLGEQGSGSFPIRTEEPPSDITAAVMVYEDAKAVGASLHEAAYSGLVRCFSMNGRHIEGLALLREMQTLGLTPRLRSYSALLAAYCASVDEECSVVLFEELTNVYNLQPLERDYLNMLRLFCATENATRFYATLHNMMEDIMVPSKEAWEVMSAWFGSGDRLQRYRKHVCRVSATGGIEELQYTLRPVELSPANKVKLLEQIEAPICSETGQAPRKRKHKVIIPGGHAAAAPVPAATVGQVDESSTAAATAKEGVSDTVKGGKHSKAKNSQAKWATFKAWIRDRKPSLTIDVVIDGANVGYYQQNFGAASGYIDYFQLDAMVRRLQHIGRHPLLILHCRHVFSDIPDMYQDVIKSWRSQNILHVTPAGCNDDTFWLYLAVLLGCDVVTNDEMRDHHFQMLSPRWFVRWKERHQIHFDFGKMSTVDLGGGRSTRMRDVELSLPLPYSHRMQIYAAEAEVISVDIEKDYAQGASGYLIPAVDCEDWLCIIPAERDRQSAELS